jgi:iron complex outermembrane recepter protein
MTGKRDSIRHCSLLALAAGLALPAAADERQAADFADMSIEELANIQVTSVSKKPEALLGAPASVFVISADDIRRSGAASLVDVLRLAPNLLVTEYANSVMSITARGLNGSSTSGPNKLLVLIDGRSVYTPLFSGVFWDAQDVLLEDIERVEVISGPGGTLWGVNAVNGVINITTRSAHASQGRLATLRAASKGADAGFRYGASTGGASYRVYGKAFQRSHSQLQDGGRVDDGWRQGQLGFRADWQSGAERLSVNGQAYRGKLEQPKPGTIAVAGVDVTLGDIHTDGANLSARWEHALADGGSFSLQAYLDHTWRQVPPTFTESIEIGDLQFQHSLPAYGKHHLVWGANYRYSWDRVKNSAVVAFLPERDNQAWASLFAQDEIALRDTLRLTLGSRLERNDYTGTEFLPSARLAWRAAPAHAFWAAASRTVRAPSRLDVDAFIPGHPPYLLAGGPEVRSEVARVYELGYRAQPNARLSWSMALFHNDYDDLRTTEINASFTQASFHNGMRGWANGIEMWANYQAGARWRLAAGMTALRERFSLKDGSTDRIGLRYAGAREPAHTFQLRSTWSVNERSELEVGLRKVGALALGPVPAYTALDARLGWRLRAGLELSASGQNLNGSHAEFGFPGMRAEVARTLALKLVWQD